MAALWLSQDGESGQVAFDNMEGRQLKGTNEWARHSVKLPLHKDGRRLVFGVLLTGTGKVWADDLELLVDGKPIWEAPKADRPTTVTDTDHEFDGGSRVLVTDLSPLQIENLVTLGKIWGFLKYHHPAVTGGQRHWDYDLFPRVAARAGHAQPNGGEHRYREVDDRTRHGGGVLSVRDPGRGHTPSSPVGVA